MISQLDALEQRLIAGYEQQLQAYEHALEIFAARSQDLERDWLTRLQEPLDCIAALDRVMTADKAAWRASGRSNGIEMRAVIDRLAKKIQALKVCVDGEVAELTARRDRLLPEMDDFIRQRWMLNAYGAATLG
jgi:hypothetical protein